MYPISYEADFKPDPSRGTTFLRLILAIPWLLVLLFWGVLFYVTHFLAWLSVIVLGRYPKWLYEFNSGVVRFLVRTSAWIYLQTDAWPPFGLGDDPNYPIRVNFPPPAARQSRLKALFRPILVLPMLIVMVPVNYIHLASAVLAWLAIVFRGYLPAAVNAMMTYCNAFYARVYGYLTILTDDYPPIGLEKSAGLFAAPPTPAA